MSLTAIFHRIPWPLLVAIAVFVLPGCTSTKTVPVVDQPQGEIVVRTAPELLKAIRPNVTIRLMPGDYNLSKASAITSDYLQWEEVFDGKEATLSNLSNLTLIGETGARVLASPRYAWIFNFKNSSNIALKNLTFGHTEAGSCVGGVLQFDQSSKITIEKCQLFGSGTEGVRLHAVSDFEMRDSDVYECTYDLLTLDASSGVLFKNTTFRETGEFTLITCIQSANIRFEGCTFSDNFTGEYIPYFFGMENNTGEVVLSGCTFKNNRVRQFSDFPDRIRRIGCTFTGNQFQDFSDSQLSKDN